MSWISDVIAQDVKLSNPLNRVTFVDNHDMPRFLSMAVNNGLPLEQAKTRLEMAMVLLLTSRGIPCIYYGTEQYLHDETASEWGSGAEPYNRQMMSGFDRQTRLSNIIQLLSALRQKSAALQKGVQTALRANNDVYVYQRKFNNECVLAALNKGRQTELELAGVGLPEGTYKSLLETKAGFGVKSLKVSKDGRAWLMMPKDSVAVWGL